jgi:alpha-1,6-mannosyltransferase
MLTRRLSPDWWTNAGLVLLGLALVALCRQGVNEIQHFVIGFGLVDMYQALLYLVAVWVVLNRPVNRWTFAIILICAAACRLVCLFSPPFLSTDIFRYVWDGQVQAAGINPYRYIPADAHLAFLRDLDIYPHINRRTYAHTIYPPGAQMLFLLITRMGVERPRGTPRAGVDLCLASDAVLGGSQQRTCGRRGAALDRSGSALLRPP